MTSLLLKIIICPLIIGIGSLFLPNVDYTSFMQPFIIGLILAVVGVGMEYILLNEDRVWLSTIMDFVTSIIIIYYGSNLFAGAEVSFLGALLISLILSIIEHMTHKSLVARNRTKNSYDYS